MDICHLKFLTFFMVLIEQLENFGYCINSTAFEEVSSTYSFQMMDPSLSTLSESTLALDDNPPLTSPTGMSTSSILEKLETDTVETKTPQETRLILGVNISLTSYSIIPTKSSLVETLMNTMTLKNISRMNVSSSMSKQENSENYMNSTLNGMSVVKSVYLSSSIMNESKIISSKSSNISMERSLTVSTSIVAMKSFKNNDSSTVANSNLNNSSVSTNSVSRLLTASAQPLSSHSMTTLSSSSSYEISSSRSIRYVTTFVLVCSSIEPTMPHSPIVSNSALVTDEPSITVSLSTSRIQQNETVEKQSGTTQENSIEHSSDISNVNKTLSLISLSNMQRSMNRTSLQQTISNVSSMSQASAQNITNVKSQTKVTANVSSKSMSALNTLSLKFSTLDTSSSLKLPVTSSTFQLPHASLSNSTSSSLLINSLQKETSVPTATVPAIAMSEKMSLNDTGVENDTMADEMSSDETETSSLLDNPSFTSTMSLEEIPTLTYKLSSFTNTTTMVNLKTAITNSTSAISNEKSREENRSPESTGGIMTTDVRQNITKIMVTSSLRKLPIVTNYTTLSSSVSTNSIMNGSQSQFISRSIKAQNSNNSQIMLSRSSIKMNASQIDVDRSNATVATKTNVVVNNSVFSNTASIVANGSASATSSEMNAICYYKLILVEVKLPTPTPTIKQPTTPIVINVPSSKTGSKVLEVIFKLTDTILFNGNDLRTEDVLSRLQNKNDSFTKELVALINKTLSDAMKNSQSTKSSFKYISPITFSNESLLVTNRLVFQPSARITPEIIRGVLNQTLFEISHTLNTSSIQVSIISSSLTAQDFDECKQPKGSICSPHAVCVNLPSALSFSCECPSKYEGDGFRCVEIAETIDKVVPIVLAVVFSFMIIFLCCVVVVVIKKNASMGKVAISPHTQYLA